MSYRVPKHIYHRQLQGDIVILDTKTDRYLGLNSSAAAAWEILAGGGSANDAAQCLVDRFGISIETALVDVSELIDELVANDLLEKHPS